MPHTTTSLNKKKAFTLIETIVSITILAIAIIGPMTLASQSIRAARETRLKLTATYLAAEGVEIVRNIRDNNSADDNSTDRAEWLDLNGSNTVHSVCDTRCIVDVTRDGSVWNEPNVLYETVSADRHRVYQHVTSGLYRQSSGVLSSGYVDSGFSRYITLTTVVNGRQEHVVSTVTYKSAGGGTRTVIAEDDLYNWFPDLDPPPP